MVGPVDVAGFDHQPKSIPILLQDSDRSGSHVAQRRIFDDISRIVFFGFGGTASCGAEISVGGGKWQMSAIFADSVEA